SIHIDQRQGMALRELDSILVWLGVGIENQMLPKGDLPVFSYLLKPSQAVPVRSQAGYDVVKTVPINVINLHLGATRAKIYSVFNPNWIVRQRVRLFPPTI